MTTEFKRSDMSKALTRYVRNAKANKTYVLCAIDMEMEGGNQCKITSYLEHLALVKYGSREISKLFMNGYLLSALGITKDIIELEDMVLEDLYDAIKEIGPSLLKDANKVIDHFAELESQREHDRELSRIDANKPKE